MCVKRNISIQDSTKQLNGNMAKCKRGEDVNYEEDLDCIDFNNYKGMFYQDDPGQKYQDPRTGAHFEFRDMCRRLDLLKKRRAGPCQTYDDRPENVQDEAEEDPRNINESGGALRALQLKTKAKESRNAGQVLTQEGYGSTLGHRKEPRHKEGLSGMRMETETRKEPSTAAAGFRSKSSDKKRAGKVATQSHNKANGPVKENIVHPLASFIERQSTYDSSSNGKKQAFADL